MRFHEMLGLTGEEEGRVSATPNPIPQPTFKTPLPPPPPYRPPEGMDSLLQAAAYFNRGGAQDAPCGLGCQRGKCVTRPGVKVLQSLLSSTPGPRGRGKQRKQQQPQSHSRPQSQFGRRGGTQQLGSILTSSSGEYPLVPYSGYRVVEKGSSPSSPPEISITALPSATVTSSTEEAASRNANNTQVITRYQLPLAPNPNNTYLTLSNRVGTSSSYSRPYPYGPEVLVELQSQGGLEVRETVVENKDIVITKSAGDERELKALSVLAYDVQTHNLDPGYIKTRLAENPDLRDIVRKEEEEEEVPGMGLWREVEKGVAGEQGRKAKQESEEEVLDLRKSNSERLCIKCGKSSDLSDHGMDADFCELCFQKARWDSFKKRSNCVWCSAASPGKAAAVTLGGVVDEKRFCSEDCLNNYKFNIFCEEANAHREQLKDLRLNGVSSSGQVVPSSQGSSRSTELITPELWLRKEGGLVVPKGENAMSTQKSPELEMNCSGRVGECSTSQPTQQQQLKVHQFPLKDRLYPAFSAGSHGNRRRLASPPLPERSQQGRNNAVTPRKRSKGSVSLSSPPFLSEPLAPHPMSMLHMSAALAAMNGLNFPPLMNGGRGGKGRRLLTPYNGMESNEMAKVLLNPPPPYAPRGNPNNVNAAMMKSGNSLSTNGHPASLLLPSITSQLSSPRNTPTSLLLPSHPTSPQSLLTNNGKMHHLAGFPGLPPPRPEDSLLVAPRGPEQEPLSGSSGSESLSPEQGQEHQEVEGEGEEEGGVEGVVVVVEDPTLPRSVATQTEETGERMKEVLPLSFLPPVTILVPYPIPFPVPIPLPLPLLLPLPQGQGGRTEEVGQDERMEGVELLEGGAEEGRESHPPEGEEREKEEEEQKTVVKAE